MTIPADKEITQLVREILTEAGKGYTPEQLAEIPNILATKYKYWWCIDMQMWDLLPDVYTEPFEAYSNGRLVPNKCIQDQVDRAAVVCDDCSTYEGWALYVDDMVKCDDGVWRIKTLRLTYRKILGKLRTMGV